MGVAAPQSHSRGRRVDVLAHPLAVCLGSLVSRLGLIHLDLGLWIHLMLCLFPFLGNLGGSKMSDTEPKGWLFSPPAGGRAMADTEPPGVPSYQGHDLLGTFLTWASASS